MRVLENYEPKKVLHFFEDICQIPHGTENTKALSDYCVAFAKERGLDVVQDHVGNIVISKPGTPGYENSQPVILQGHLDMVCEKTLDSTHDFENDPLPIYVDDKGFIRSKGTTLGGDDGIAIAYALAVLDEKEIEHPPIEALFTVDEETTMIGAEEIDMNLMKGKLMINIDSEYEGILTVGCAGGLTFISNIPLEKKIINKEIVKIHIKGLLGGHSGIEIDLQRGNANKMMGQLLQHLSWKKGHKFDLISVNGGEKENVITYSCIAEIGVCCAECRDAIIADVAALEALWKKEIGKDEPDLEITTEVIEAKEVEALVDADAKKVIQFLAATPHGVMCYNRELEGQVETSLNIGVVKTLEKDLFVNYFIRSSIDTKRDEAAEELAAYVGLVGGTAEISSVFPAWSYVADSDIRPIMVEVYEEMYGKKPVVETVHAGLECGIFAGKRPELDAVSIGPNLGDIHSVNETAEIASIERTWEYLKAVLKRLK